MAHAFLLVRRVARKAKTAVLGDFLSRLLCAHSASFQGRHYLLAERRQGCAEHVEKAKIDEPCSIFPARIVDYSEGQTHYTNCDQHPTVRS
jgi:hypothetical protein